MNIPIPDDTALTHSAKVKRYIADKIQQSGNAIPFSEYMEHVLYAPGLGYYSAGCMKFGETGDFITAPEISSLFSRCIARAISPVLNELSNASILEVGAGSGKMAADILIELAETEITFDYYYILERSAELRERQQLTLQRLAPNLLSKVQWLDSLPKTFSGTIVANELLDAMPIQRFKKTKDSVVEMYVALDNDEFCWREVSNQNSRLESRIDNIEKNQGVKFSEGYISEINFSAEDWLSSICAILDRGYILLLDYGYPEKEYYHQQRTSGTLNCFYQHRRHENPFLYPGLQDITAHIDFSNLADKVVNSSVMAVTGLHLDGYTTQAQFLMASGLTALVQEHESTNIKQSLKLSQEIKKLTMPYEMGENVKVIGFEKGLSDSSEFKLPCFNLRDLRYQL